jgi:cytochrome c peroxidase
MKTFGLFSWLVKVFPHVAGMAILISAGLPQDVLASAVGDTVAVGTESYFPLAFGNRPTKAELASLGQRIFLDTGLSASGKVSCASCHSPNHAFGSPNELMTQQGGAMLNRSGFRNTPSLTYLHSPIAFTEHFYEPEVTGGRDDEGATGGRTWDGRVNAGSQQALLPLMDQNEMANTDVSEVFLHPRIQL